MPGGTRAEGRAAQTEAQLSPDLRIDHLLVIAGPSGAGKSTFLKQLARGQLDPSIMELLPPGAHSWVQTDGCKVIRNPLTNASATDAIGGCCFHYDILRPFSSEIAGYSCDPSLRVAANARQVSLIMLNAPPDQLARQLLARSFGRPRSFRALRRRIADELPAWIRQMSLLDSERRRARAMWRQRHLIVADYYRRDGWIDEWCQRWTGFVDREFGDRLTGPASYIRPVLAKPGRPPSFEVDDPRPIGTRPAENCGEINRHRSP